MPPQLLVDCSDRRRQDLELNLLRPVSERPLRLRTPVGFSEPSRLVRGCLEAVLRSLVCLRSHSVEVCKGVVRLIGTSVMLGSIGPVTNGTAGTAYQPVKEKDGNTNNYTVYQTITCMDAYKGASLEVGQVWRVYFVAHRLTLPGWTSRRNSVCRITSRTERPLLPLVPTLSVPVHPLEACSANPLNNNRRVSLVPLSLPLPGSELELVPVCSVSLLNLREPLLSVSLSRVPGSELLLQVPGSLDLTPRALGLGCSVSKINSSPSNRRAVYLASKTSRAVGCSVNPVLRERPVVFSGPIRALLRREGVCSANSNSRTLSRLLQVRFRLAQTTRTKPSLPLEGLGLGVSISRVNTELDGSRLISR
jgi:hypothetical protein